MRFHKVSVFFLLGAAVAAAQETRGDISGTIADPQASAVVGAIVTVTNLETNGRTGIRTNSSGYYLAPLLMQGNYEVVVAAPGFKKLIRSGLTLAVMQHMNLNLTLEVGAVSESVTVTAEAPLLDTTTVTAGQQHDRLDVQSLPVFANMTILLTRFTPGVNASTDVQYVGQGYINRTSSDYGTLGNIGGSEWTIDGAPNNGSDRRMAVSPNSEMVQEMRVETSAFDAAQGHGVGLAISMMTRNGTNGAHGSANWQYWNQRWNSANFFQRQVYFRNIANAAASGNTAQAAALAAKPIMLAGASKSVSLTLGGPVYIPKVYNGKNKLFFFFDYSWNHDLRAGANASGVDTVPTMANRAGDFSQLLHINSSYQIYDPLTVIPDPTRPGHYTRTAFPGNIIPKSRINNPIYNYYSAHLPVPCCDPTDPTQQPISNQRTAGDPDPIYNQIYGNRIDYNLNDKQRFFFRWETNTFTEGLGDWTWQVQPGLSSNDTYRNSLGGTFNWTYAKSERTVITAQVSDQKYKEWSLFKTMATIKPSDVGLPTYMDQKCAITQCTLPIVSWSGYHTLGQGAPNGYTVQNAQESVNVTQIYGAHTLHFGADVRQALRTYTNPGSSGGAFTFDSTYTQKNDDTSVSAPGSLGFSWAAFMLGIPTSSAITTNDNWATYSPYYGTYVQDAWRATPKLTVNFGLRLEFEQGLTERYNRMLVGWDPNAQLPISSAAQAAYAASPLATLPASSFLVRGGSLYADTPQYPSRATWKSQAMLMPRFAVAWQASPKTVVRVGYGIYYDTLNAAELLITQTGFSQTTTNVSSNNFGTTWNNGNPGAGISPLSDPFPVLSNGQRFQAPYGNALGSMGLAGTSYTYWNPKQPHLQLQRWRAGIQRALGSNMSFEAVYTGMYTGNGALSVNENPIPKQYWNMTNSKNAAGAALLTSNVTNPFYINNFQSLQASNPLLYTRLASLPLFTSPTISYGQLVTAYPEMTGLTAAQDPIKKFRSHSLDMNWQRRLSAGLSLNAALSLNKAQDWSTVLNPYDLGPEQWLPSNNARPYRITASGIYQLPFGKGRPFWKSGILNAVFGGWQTGATFELQPGPLLTWPNLFFNGDLSSIKNVPGGSSLNEWFNVNAGFVKDPNQQPTAYQSRVFPLYVDGIRQCRTQLLNANVQKTFTIKERVNFLLRVDGNNALNRSHFAAPDMIPTDTTFGKVTADSSTITRYLNFVGKITF